MSRTHHQAQSGDEQSSDPAIRDVFFGFGLFVLAVFALDAAAVHLIPIVMAVLIWFLINAVAHALCSIPILRHILPFWLALTIGAALTLGVIYAAGQIVFTNISDLTAGLSGFSDKAAQIVETIEGIVGFQVDLDIRTALNNLQVQDFLTDIISALGATANTTLLTLLYVLFLLLDQPFYDAKIRALFPNQERQTRVRAVLARISADTRAYVWIMTIVSVGVGLLTYGIAEYFGLRGAPFWGFLAFALNYIPTIGSFLGVLFPTAYAMVQFDDIEPMFAFAIALGIVQFVMGNLLLPRMTGDRLNLSQFVVILSLTVWGAMWGAAGLFLAVPIMMVLTIGLSQLDATRPLAVILSQNGRVGED